MGEHRGRITGRHGEYERGAVLRKVTSYRDHLLKMIDLELEHEMEVLTDRLKNWSKQRLTSTGTALFDLEARTAGWMFSERIIALRNRGSRLPEHRFGHGDMVIISRARPWGEKVIEGVVLDRSNSRIRIVTKDKPSDLRKGGWRLDRGANRVAHDRMHDALISFHSTEGDGGTVLRENLWAWDIAEYLGKPMIGGSDAHSFNGVGRYMTVFEDEIDSVQSLLYSLRNGSYYPAQLDDNNKVIPFRR